MNQHEFKKGDRVRVKAGQFFLGMIGTVFDTDCGEDQDLTILSDSELLRGVATANLEPAPVEEAKPASTIPPRPFMRTISPEGLTTETPDQVAARLSEDFLKTMVEDCLNYRGSNPRQDGHSTGPILTGDARESYLAIQSGAEDPYAKPEPLTEPSCGYCKDTGIGVMGMDCPVRTCEAVST